MEEIVTPKGDSAVGMSAKVIISKVNLPLICLEEKPPSSLILEEVKLPDNYLTKQFLIHFELAGPQDNNFKPLEAG